MLRNIWAAKRINKSIRLLQELNIDCGLPKSEILWACDVMLWRMFGENALQRPTITTDDGLQTQNSVITNFTLDAHFFLFRLFSSSPTSESKLASLLVRLWVLRADI